MFPHLYLHLLHQIMSWLLSLIMCISCFRIYLFSAKLIFSLQSVERRLSFKFCWDRIYSLYVLGPTVTFEIIIVILEFSLQLILIFVFNILLFWLIIHVKYFMSILILHFIFVTLSVKTQLKGESHFSVLPLPRRLTPSPCPSKPSGKRKGWKHSPMKRVTTWLLLRHHTSSLAGCYVTRGNKCWSQTCRLQVCVCRLHGF